MSKQPQRDTDTEKIGEVDGLKVKLGIRRDRRTLIRLSGILSIAFRFKLAEGGFETVAGTSLTLTEEGVSCLLETQIPINTKYAYIESVINSQSIKIAGKVIWVSDDRLNCGVRLDASNVLWKEFMNAERTRGVFRPADDRRARNRRLDPSLVDKERRATDRRFAELSGQPVTIEDVLRVKKFLRNKASTYTAEMIHARRQWLEGITDTKLKHLSVFSEDPGDFRGKIESPIGVAHVPVGIAGPLKVNGQYAKGIFFVPMGTTEGALITSYTFGSSIVTRSGGANVKILSNALKSDPTFVFDTGANADSFLLWITKNESRIKEIGERTSSHLKITKISPVMNGRRVILNMHFDTGDAMGMNMAYKATDVICKMIRDSVHPEEFWLHSNYSSIKKTTAHNFINGYGRTVFAEVTVPRKVVTLLNTSPEKMERYFFRTLLGSAQGILFGVSAHIANAMAAISIACGQDAALVANTHGATITCEVTGAGDLYYGAHFPCIFAATVGGGTSFGTGRECLEILGCYGTGKANKLAEIIAATALAGEISLMTSVVNGTYISAHETFGRNKPADHP